MATRYHGQYKNKGFRSTGDRIATAREERGIGRAVANEARRAAAMMIAPMPMARRNYGRPTGVRPEVKSFDLAPNAPASWYIPAYTAPPGGVAANDLSNGMMCLNCGIRQGAEFYKRVGTRVNMKSAHVHIDIANIATYITGASSIRIMVFYDRQANGAYPAFADILQINDTGATLFNAGINMANRSRFSILRDQVFILDEAAQVGHHINWFIKTKGLEVEFGTDTGGIADVKTGALYMLMFWDTEGSPGHPPYYRNVSSRIRYYD
nr:MAG: capsid protein [Cressdnaviricota sp.]